MKGRRRASRKARPRQDDSSDETRRDKARRFGACSGVSREQRGRFVLISLVSWCVWLRMKPRRLREKFVPLPALVDRIHPLAIPTRARAARGLVRKIHWHFQAPLRKIFLPNLRSERRETRRQSRRLQVTARCQWLTEPAESAESAESYCGPPSP